MTQTAACRQIRQSWQHTGSRANRRSAVNTGFHGYFPCDLNRSVCIKDNVKIDPACGSGVFLVNAFKQELQRLRNEKKNLDARDAEELLKNRIFGVDINGMALKIACFSLYVALLDEFDPRDIVENEFHFPPLLGENLFECSFFSRQVNSLLREVPFDIIAGNPPWKSNPVGDHKPYCRSHRIPLSDYQTAQAFMCRVADFSDTATDVALIVTNSIFTNKKTAEFRRYFFSNYTVDSILNLSEVKDSLFQNAKSPGTIIWYRCEPSVEYKIKYFAFRDNILFRIFRRYIYDMDEEIELSSSVVLDEERYRHLWTALTVGDEYDVACIASFWQFPPLLKTVSTQLRFLEGDVSSSKGDTNEKYAEYKGGSLHGSFKPYHINYDDIPYMDKAQKYSRARKDERQFLSTDKLLVKRTFDKKNWGAAYIDKPLVYSNVFHCFFDTSGENKRLLKYLEGIFNSKLFRYYCYYASKAKATTHPEIPKEDIEVFPMPELRERDIVFIVDYVERLEKIVDAPAIVKDYSEEIAQYQKKIDQYIFSMYGLDAFQVSVIEDGLERYDGNQTYSKKAMGKDYQVFGDYICEYFNFHMHLEGKSVWKWKLHEEELFSALTFFMGEESGNFYGSDAWGMALLEEVNSRLLVQRRIQYFSENGFTIIQSNDCGKWSLRKAKKETVRLTKYIMNRGTV